MPRLQITDTNLEKLKLPTKEKPCLYWDAGENSLKGFGCRATSTGITFIVQRRIGGRHGRTVRASIGKWGEKSASKARKDAAAELSKLRDDIDLIKVKKIKQVKDKTEKITLQEIFDEYMKRKSPKTNNKRKSGKERLRPATEKLYCYLMKNYLACKLSTDNSDRNLTSLPISLITKDMIETKLEILATEPGKREKRPDRSAQAAQCFRLLRALFNFAARKYKVDGKPLVSVDWVNDISQDTNYEPEPRNTIISENELEDWYQAVLRVSNPVLRDYILWLAFSGMRRTEAMTLRMSDIDLKNKAVKIRAEVSKTRKERVMPLTNVLASILERRKSDKEHSASIIPFNAYLFKGLKPGQHIQEPKRAIANVCKAIDKQWSLHDLRRTYATHGSRLIPYSALKELLGHSSGKGDITDRHYVRLDLESLRPEAQKLADWLANKMGMEAASLEVINQ